MANANAIRVALVRKLLDGGHRLRVEHIVERLTPRELCSLIRDLPDREARSVASLVLGPALGAGAVLERHPLAVVVAALARVDADWGSDYLAHMREAERETVLAALPPARVEALRECPAVRPARRFRWPWRRHAEDAAQP